MVHFSVSAVLALLGLLTCVKAADDAKAYDKVYGKRALKGKQHKKKSRGKHKKGKGVEQRTNVEHMLECEDYCHKHTTVCIHDEFFQEGYAGCIAACENMPRTAYEPVYDLSFDEVALGSDTLACRATHLSFAIEFGGGGDLIEAQMSNDALFHCGHASPGGEGICTDHAFGRKKLTPFQIEQRGASTRRELGRTGCVLSAKDSVVNCQRLGMDDSIMANMLSKLPHKKVEHLFLHGNDLSEIPDLQEFKKLKSLYLDGNDITKVQASDLSELSKLEILSLNVNPISELPCDLLRNTRKLKTFSLFNGDLSGSFDADLFSYTPDLENIIMYGNDLTHFEEGSLDGLTKLKILSFVDCSFDWDGFPEGVFDDLHSLLYFDFFLNAFEGPIPAGLFAGPWSKNIFRIVFWGNGGLNGIEEGALTPLDNLELAFFHGTTVPSNNLAEEIARVPSNKFKTLTEP